MIIECPACTSRYRIREDKLPSEGGNIKCPNCAHVFFVPRAERSSASISASVQAVSSDPVSVLEGASETKRWKLKNSVGLIYDFPDVEQLRGWLVSRESFEGIQVSSDGGDSWCGVAEEPDLAGVKPTGSKVLPHPPQTTGSRAAIAQQGAKTVDQLKSEAEARLREVRRTRDQESGSAQSHYKLLKPPATKEAQRTGRMLLILALFVLPLLAAVALHNTGVINLRDIEVFEEPNPEGPVGVALPDRGYLPPEVVEIETPPSSFSTDRAVATLINRAGAAEARGETASAIQHLENALSLSPEDRELSCILAPIYESEQRIGDAGLATEHCHGGEESEGSGDTAGAEVDGASAEGEALPVDGSGDTAAQTP